MQKDIKNIQHADDLTLALTDINSLNIAITTVEDFCKHTKKNQYYRFLILNIFSKLKKTYLTLCGTNMIE